MFAPIMLTEYVPIYNSGNGDCLYRSVSQGFFRTEEQYEYLRLIATIEMTSYPVFYDTSNPKYIDLWCDDNLLHDDYKKLLEDVSHKHKYASMMHISALSAALGEPINFYCPPCDVQTVFILNFVQDGLWKRSTKIKASKSEYHVDNKS